MKQYDHILFDLDGTLVESAEGVRVSLSYAMQELGLPCPDLSDYTKYVGPPLEDTFRGMCAVPEELIPVGMRLYRDHYDAFGQRSSRLYDGVTELLEGLRAAGKKIFLLSNAQESFTIPEMDELGILGYFDGIMISSEERICKPQRQFFEKLLAKFGLDPKESLMVGNDKNSDMLGAESVGIDGVYIHQDISPEVRDESEIRARLKIMDGDVHRILPFILEEA